jgi:hypothetical protein
VSQSLIRGLATETKAEQLGAGPLLKVTFAVFSVGTSFGVSLADASKKIKNSQ